MSDDRSAFLEVAQRIGARICRDAVWDGRRCNWFGWAAHWFHGQWTPSYRALGPTTLNPYEGVCLYGGTAGIALFLARLFDFTKDATLRETLAGAVNQISDRLSALEPAARCGLYSGPIGVGYAMIEVGRILAHDGLVKRGIEQLLGCRGAAAETGALDVIDGVAGAIPVLIDVGRRFERPELLDAAVAFGRQLVDKACRAETGWSWKTTSAPARHNLLGYSHGVAGIVVALLELNSLTGDASFATAAREGLRYERSHFDSSHGNWPDFRLSDEQPNDDPPANMIAWCHGAVGVGLSRLRARQFLGDDAEIDREITVAINTTEQHLAPFIRQPADDYCLCHGVFGNAELLLQAGHDLHEPRLLELADSLGHSGSEMIEQPQLPWPCNRGNGGETPALMMGLTGIGYFYLRLYDFASVPSVLIISPASD